MTLETRFLEEKAREERKKEQAKLFSFSMFHLLVAGLSAAVRSLIQFADLIFKFKN